jgi:hypothetical protein
MRQRLPLVFSATALVVAVFGVTPLGQAAGNLIGKAVPVALFAKNAGKLNGHTSSVAPKAEQIPVLGPDGKLPASIGAVGPKGDQGLPGQSATKLWAVVHTDGTTASLVRGSGATAVIQTDVGFINVTFNQNVDSCAYLVTTGLDNFTKPPTGGATADRDPAAPKTVYVQTFDLAGTPKALDYFLAVFC